MTSESLYHGTLAHNVESILRDGLRPRGANPSNDEHLGMPSLPQFVYLADRPLLAANHASRISADVYHGVPIAVIEIDTAELNTRLLYPDEDWLKVECEIQLHHLPLNEQMKMMRANKRAWRESLSWHHTVAYRGIIKKLKL